MSSFNWVDYLILIVFILSILGGLARGLVRELFSLVVLVLAFAIAIALASPLADMFSQSVAVQNVVSQASTSSGTNAAQPISYVLIGLSFASVFIVVLIIGSIISYFIGLFLSYGVLGIGNRLLGAIFGFARGYIINLVLIFVIQLTPLSHENWWKDSQLVPTFDPAVHWLNNLVAPSLESLKEKMGETIKDVSTEIHSMANTLFKNGIHL